jgi:hypothetical protein
MEGIVSSKRELVLQGLKRLITSALPSAEVVRNLAKPERIPKGGLVVIRDGDSGEPEIVLSPLTYIFSHRVTIEIAAESREIDRDQLLDPRRRFSQLKITPRNPHDPAIAGKVRCPGQGVQEGSDAEARSSAKGVQGNRRGDRSGRGASRRYPAVRCRQGAGASLCISYI